MADDTEKPQFNKAEEESSSVNETHTHEEVDVDSLTIKILIICDNRPKFDSVATFLNRRGWEATVTTRLEEAIKVLASDRPDFVMVSMNHKNKKVAVLPSFISQTFNTKTIVFGEKSDSKTIGMIHSAKTPFKMMGIVSGPSVHRKIKQILNDIHNKKDSADGNKKGFSANGEGGPTVIAGSKGAKAADMPSVQRFANSAKARDAGSTSYSNQSKTKKDLPIIQQGTKQEKKDAEYNQTKNRDKESSLMAKGSFENEAFSRAEGNINSHNENSTAKGFREDELSKIASVFTKNENINNLPDDKSELYKTLKKVIDRVSDSVETLKNPIDEVSTVGIVSLQSQDLNGYLVIGASTTLKDEEDFIIHFKKKLESDLNLGDKDYLLERIVSCEVPRVDFYNFAKNKGKLVLSEVHHGAEFCVAFFENKNPIPTVKETIGHFKSQIDIDDLPVDESLTFNSYLHLKKNQKYFMFLRGSNFLQEKQKEKLQKNNVSLFIDRSDIEKYKDFYIQNFIKQLVVDYTLEEDVTDLKKIQ